MTDLLLYEMDGNEPFWCYNWWLQIKYEFIFKSYIKETVNGYGHECDKSEKASVIDDYKKKTNNTNRLLNSEGNEASS